MKHPLKFVRSEGLLAEALGLTPEECSPLEALVERYVRENRSMKELLEAAGDLDISDEVWANFLYTFGWWARGRLA